MANKPLIYIDSREQQSWELKGYPIERHKLDAGDYQIADQDIICLERKATVVEYWNNLVLHKDRFFREMKILSQFKHKAIICEFSYADMLVRPDFFKKRISPFYILKITMDIWLDYDVPTLYLGSREASENFACSCFKRGAERLSC